jgi:hypothetical protein
VGEASSLCFPKEQSEDASPTLYCLRPILIATKHARISGTGHWQMNLPALPGDSSAFL